MRLTDYESAALPTELSRQADLAGSKGPNPYIPATTAPRRVSDVERCAAADYHSRQIAQLYGRSADESAPPVATLHERIVGAYVERFGARMTGFAAEIRRKYGGEFDVEELHHKLVRSVVPDAFVVSDSADGYTLTAVEVQVTHPVSARKLDRYLGIFWEVDAISPNGSLALHLVERNGSVFQVDLSTLAIRHINDPIDDVGDLPGWFLEPLSLVGGK